jgi:hypothetical protein
MDSLLAEKNKLIKETCDMCNKMKIEGEVITEEDKMKLIDKMKFIGEERKKIIIINKKLIELFKKSDEVNKKDKIDTLEKQIDGILNITWVE